VDRFGEEGFVEQYRKERQRVQLALAGKTLARVEWKGGRQVEAPRAATPRRIFKQKQAGLYTFPVNLPLGAITVEQLRGLKDIAEALDVTEIRTTTDQNLLFLNVPEARLSALSKGLQKLNLRIARTGDDVVACSGTTTCPLGLTASPYLAEKLGGGCSDLRIRVSGCVNGCAQPEAGDIGLYGEAKRAFGRLIPHYQITLGGTACQNAYSRGSNLAIEGPLVPARRAVEAVQRIEADYEEHNEVGQNFIDWSRTRPEGHFDALLEDLLEIKEGEVDKLASDVGCDTAFVVQTGANECAGPRKLYVAPAFTQAAHERNYRDIFMAQRRYAEALKSAEAILLHLGKTLLPVSLGGVILPVAGLADLAFRANSPRSPQPQLGAQLDRLSAQLEYWAEKLDRLKVEPPLDALTAFFEEVDAWNLKVAEYWSANDSGLYLKPWLPAARQPVPAEVAQSVAVI
jgi:sulfite reductase (NADPH) hemoprotein beta-component